MYGSYNLHGAIYEPSIFAAVMKYRKVVLILFTTMTDGLLKMDKQTLKVSTLQVHFGNKLPQLFVFQYEN